MLDIFLPFKNIRNILKSHLKYIKNSGIEMSTPKYADFVKREQ